MRIKAITEYDSPAREVMLNKRTFEYTIPGTNTSSGELFAIPMYYWPKWRAWCVDRKAKHEVTTFERPQSFHYPIPLDQALVTVT